MFRAFVLYSPQGFITASTSSARAAENASKDGYFANSSGVTLFTRASVHCADSRAAINSFHGSS
jgi:hypothetical protein